METPLSRHEVWSRFLLYPSHTLPTAAAPVVVAAGLAIRDDVLAPIPLLLAFVGSWLIHLAGVIADNHELLRRHGDVPEHPELLRALKDGVLTLRGLRLAIYACIGLAIACGIHLVVVGGVPALLIGAIGIVASLGYACGPIRYGRTGIADAVFLLMFGVVAVAATYFVQAAAELDSMPWSKMPWDAFVLGLPVGCLVTAVLVIDDIRDREFDAAKGWRTTAVRFGIAGSRTEWFALVATAYLAPLWFWLGLGASPTVLLSWATMPMAIRIGVAVHRFDTAQELLGMTPRTSVLSLAFAVLLAIGIALA